MNQLTKAAKTLAAKYNSTSLILRIAIGLVIGSVLALICPGAAWIEEFGNLFVGALKGVAPVLVFVIVASALATITNTSTGATPFSAPTNKLPNSSIHAAPGQIKASTEPITRPIAMRRIRLVELYLAASVLAAFVS